jgi:hypothetical protein
MNKGKSPPFKKVIIDGAASDHKIIFAGHELKRALKELYDINTEVIINKNNNYWSDVKTLSDFIKSGKNGVIIIKKNFGQFVNKEEGIPKILFYEPAGLIKQINQFENKYNCEWNPWAYDVLINIKDKNSFSLFEDVAYELKTIYKKLPKRF